MTTAFQHLQAVIFDWAGTTVDHGSCAPTIVFQEIFRQRGVPISAAQAREPMGTPKRDHIAAIAAMPDVAAAWNAKYGRPCGDADVDAMYSDFLPLQKDTLRHHSRLIAGVPELAEWCRAKGLKIGSTTGYTRELLEVVTSAAAEQGYIPDCALGSEDAPQGRPAPFLIYTAAMKLGVYPLWTIVKVDDTPVGITAGRNAGCWTVGVTRTGNGVGLSEDELEQLTGDERRAAIRAAGATLTSAGAHVLVESVADIRPVFEDFDRRLAAGERP